MKFRAVPRSYPLRSLVCTLFNKGGNRRAFRLPGVGRGSFPLYGGISTRSYSVSKLGKKWLNLDGPIRSNRFAVSNRLLLANDVRVPELRGEQKAPENATHPKTQKTDRSENLRFWVCCVFGCSLFPSKRAPKHTRKRNAPENADFWNGLFSAFSGVLRFRVLFGACQRTEPLFFCESRFGG